MKTLLDARHSLGAFNCCYWNCCYWIVQSLSHVWLFAIPWTAACQAPLSSSRSQVCSDSCPSSRWCYLTNSSSAAPFSLCLQSFPASWSFLMSPFFTSSGQSIECSVSVLPVNIQGWFPLGLTDLISLLSKGLSRVYENHNSKPSVLWLSTFMVWISHPYTTTGKTI